MRNEAEEIEQTRRILDNLQKCLKDRVGPELAEVILEIYNTTTHKGKHFVGLFIGGKNFSDPSDPLPVPDPKDRSVRIDLTPDLLEGVETVSAYIKERFQMDPAQYSGIELLIEPHEQLADESAVTMNGFHAPNYDTAPMVRTPIENFRLTGLQAVGFWGKCFSLATGHPRNIPDPASDSLVVPNTHTAKFLNYHALGKLPNTV